MKKIFVYICIILILNEGLLLAQEGSEDPLISNLIPPSPTASSLGQYGDVPVSLYTGTPNISVPIFELKGRSLSVPIFLSYHASGVRVDQISGWVGLGWSLNSGGVITRTVKGIADESIQGFRGPNQIGNKVYDYINGQLPIEEHFIFKNNLAKGHWDGEPDLYHFNFQGNSGKIVFDHNGNPSIIPFQNLKIEGDGSINVGFTITDLSGAKYVFMERELTSSVNTCESDPLEQEDVTAWYLTQIISARNEEINFYYDNESLNYEVSNSETKKYLIQSTGPTSCPLPSGPCLSELNIQAKRLIRIESDNLMIKFIKSTNTYVFGGHLLGKIEIFRKSDLTFPVMGFEFNYDLIDRITLTSISEIGESGSYKQPHLFSYYRPGTISIPPRLSSKQDHWGYFNSNNANTLVPEMIYRTYSGSYITLSGGNREPNPELSKLLILTKITYPTGGSTNFEFEAHDYGFYNSNEYEENIYDDEILSVVALNTSITQSEVITIYEEQVASLSMIPSTPPWMVNEHGEAVGEINLVGIDNPISYSISSVVPSSSKSMDVGLQPGQYILTAESYEDEGSMKAKLYYKRKTGTTTKGIAGGLRIKSIIDKSIVGSSEDIIKEFQYAMSSDPQRSSGVLLSIPRYDYENIMWIADEGTGGIGYSESKCWYHVRTSNSQATLGSTQGSHIGYREVTVLTGVNGTGGKSWYKFSSPFEEPDNGSIYRFPFPPATSFDHRRGNELSSITYKNNNGVFDKVMETINTYIVDQSQNRKLIEALKIGFAESSQGEITNVIEFEEANYDYHQEWIYLSESTKIQYGGNENLERTIKYLYDNPTHTLITGTETLSSSGQLLKTKIKYPQDYPVNAGSIIESMIDQHLLNKKIEEISYNDEKVIGAIGYQYQLMPNQNMILPMKSFAYEPVDAFSIYTESINGYDFPEQIEKIFYDKWDEYGNLIEFHKSSNLHTTIIWGYNHSFPIAKIVNASYSKIESALGGAGIVLQGENGNNLSESQIILLRGNQGLDKAQIFTYTYNVLIGITSQTDFNGKTTTYHYDDFNRLKSIEDFEGNILKAYKYHYKSNAN